MRLLILTVLAVTLSACGFALRGSQPLPPMVSQVNIVTTQPHEPLARALAKRLNVYQLKGGININSDKLTSVVVRMNPEHLERRLLSVFATGQVAEYELIYAVDYEVQFPGEDAVSAYFEVLRDYQDDPDQVLAKSRELDLVLDEMRQEAADRIIRLLPSQANAAGM